MPYVNPVVLNRMVEVVVAGKLQEFKDANQLSSPDYSKPYPQWHDEISFSSRYQQLKFQMFDGSGDPDQHMPHFMSAYGDTIRTESLLLWQFVLSLKGPVKDWYSKLLPNSIPDSFHGSFLQHLEGQSV